jgi:CheY-like chemotaxis protein
VPDSNPSPGRILLVEDHEDTAELMQQMLAGAGYEVRIASTLAQALDELEKPTDLILSDLRLPDGSGNDLVRHAKTRYATKAIALSGYGTDSDIRDARDAGFDAQLTKPINFKQLESIISQLVSESKSAIPSG